MAQGSYLPVKIGTVFEYLHGCRIMLPSGSFDAHC